MESKDENNNKINTNTSTTVHGSNNSSKKADNDCYNNDNTVHANDKQSRSQQEGDSQDINKETKDNIDAEMKFLAERWSTINNVFAHEQPKDIASGLGDGVRNVLVGVASGLAIIPAGVIAGGREDGVKGAAIGLGAGLLAGTALCEYGMFMAGKQALRGAIQTPETIKAVVSNEQWWDSSKREWRRVNLRDEMEALPTNDDEDVKIAGRENYIKMQELMRAEELAEKQRQAKDKEKEEQQKEKENDDHQNAKTAEDTETTKNSSASDPAGYYALLGISPSSQPSPAEIKRAFTHKALEMHPDKNLNDPEANMKFQQLMKAYQILHNPVSRHAYDHPEHLTDNELEELYNRNSHFNGVDDNENPLAEIIGSRALEPLIGKLNFVLYFDSNVCYTSEMMKTLEERRRLRIAKQLLEFLDVDIVNGLSSTNEISKNNDNKKLDYGLERATNVIKEALSTRLGPVFVHAVAETYHIAAKQHLYNNMVKREISSWWENKRLSWQSTTQIVSASIAALKRAANKTISEEDVMRLLEVANLADIKRHVLRACRMTLYDVSVTPEQRMRRAERLEILSQLTFQLVDEELALRAVASHDNAAHSAS